MPTRRIIFIVVFVGMVIMVIMGLWPPWKEIFNWLNIHNEKPVGYYFILEPPEPKSRAISFTIDLPRLLIQWFLVILIVGFIVWALKWFEKRTMVAGKDSSAIGPE